MGMKSIHKCRFLLNALHTKEEEEVAFLLSRCLLSGFKKPEDSIIYRVAAFGKGAITTILFQLQLTSEV